MRFLFRPQAAVNLDGTPVQSGVFAVYAPDDTQFATPLPVYAPGGSTSIGTVSVTNYVSAAFEVDDHQEVYLKSGDMPAVAVISAGGALAAAVAAKNDAEAAQALAEDASADAVAARAQAETARDEAVAARDEAVAHVEVLAAPSDAQVAGYVGGVGGATRAALDAIYTPREMSPLRRWYAALAGRTASPAQVLVIGDSISEGTGTTDVSRRWVNRLQADLCSRYAVPRGAEFPFIPAYPATTSPGMPVVRAGTVTSANFGIGLRTAAIPDATGSVTFTFTGTSCKVMFTAGSGAAIARVVVDGGTPVLVDTYNAALTGGLIHEIAGLTRGEHTVVITRDATSAAGRTLYVEGLLTFDGDEDAGIRVLDGSHHGYSSNNFFSTAMWANSVAAAGLPDLVILLLGTNDYSVRTADEFKTRMANIVGKLATAGFVGSVVYGAPYRGSGRPIEEWQPYVDALAELAAADPNGVFIDLSDRMPTPQSPEPNPESLGLYVDGLHPSDRGHGFLGDVFAGLVSLG